MKEIETNSNTVKGAISQLFKQAMKEDKPVFMEINDIIIMVTPKHFVRWKRDIKSVIYDGNEMIVVSQN